jgi:hypothetical protein
MVALSIVAAFCIPAQAQTTPLEGSMSIGGLTAFHAPPDKPKNTHAGFVIDGAAALRMFKAMKARAKPDECADEGWVSKFAGPMFYALAPGGKKAACYVRISLIDGTTEGSRQGC